MIDGLVKKVNDQIVKSVILRRENFYQERRP